MIRGERSSDPTETASRLAPFAEALDRRRMPTLMRAAMPVGASEPAWYSSNVSHMPLAWVDPDSPRDPPVDLFVRIRSATALLSSRAGGLLAGASDFSHVLRRR